MVVEKRYQNRVTINLDVQLIYRKRAFDALAVNVTSEGMGFQLDALKIPCGMLLELDFKLAEMHWVIPSVVTHSRGDEIGVMFIARQKRLLASVLVANGATELVRKEATCQSIYTSEHASNMLPRKWGA